MKVFSTEKLKLHCEAFNHLDPYMYDNIKDREREFLKKLSSFGRMNQKDEDTVKSDINSSIACGGSRYCNHCVFKDSVRNPVELGFKDVQAVANLSKITDFPVDKLPKLLSDYVKQASEALVAPPEFIGTALLSLLATFISRYNKVQPVPSWELPLNFWSIICGGVSTKKSVCFEQVHKLTKNLLYEEGESKRIMTNDTTIEALFELLSKNKSIMWFGDELGSIVCGAYKKGAGAEADRAKLLSLWTCQSVCVDRKGASPIEIEEPILTISAGVQPEVLKSKRIGSDLISASGYLQRFVFAICNDDDGTYFGTSKKAISEDIIMKMKYLFQTLLNKGFSKDNFDIITFDKEAQQLFDEFEYELKEDLKNIESSALKSYYTKFLGHTAKIAGILHLVRTVTENIDSNTINKDTLDMAITIGRYYLNTGKEIFSETAQKVDITKAYLYLVNKCTCGWFFGSYLNKNNVAGAKQSQPEIAEEIINTLIEQNRIVKLPTPKGTKYSILFDSKDLVGLSEADRTREKYEKAIQEEKSDKEWKNFVAEIIPKSNY